MNNFKDIYHSKMHLEISYFAKNAIKNKKIKCNKEKKENEKNIFIVQEML